MRKKILCAAILAAALAASQPLCVFAAGDPQEVENRIQALPEEDKLTAADADTVRDVMNAYNELTTADKLSVPDYEKLEQEYSDLVSSGFLADSDADAQAAEDKKSKEQDAMSVSGDTKTGSTDYVFNADDGAVSIVIHYMTDTDGDGTYDAPDRIVLTSPDGNTTPVRKTDAQLKDASMDITVTWEDSFVQLDVAKAAAGKWRITTSTPCAFASMGYAGPKENITAEGEQGTKADAEGVESTAASSSSESDPDSSDSENSGGTSSVGVIAVFVIFGGVFAFLIHGIRGTGKEKKAQKANAQGLNIPKPLSDEEVLQQLKEENNRLKKEEETDEDDDEETEAGTDTAGAAGTPDDGDDEDEDDEEDDDEEDDEDDLDEFNEGDTGLLSQKDRPDGGEETTDDGFGEF